HRRVTVGPQQELSRPGESLEMKVMRDAVARSRIEQPVAPGETAQVRVILRVLVVELKNVVVDVRDRRYGDSLEAESLELETGHRARRVLEQDLVDAELDVLLGARHEVLGDDLLRERPRPRHRQSVNPSPAHGRALIAEATCCATASPTSRVVELP